MANAAKQAIAPSVKTAKSPNIEVTIRRPLIANAEFETIQSVFIDQFIVLHRDAYAISRFQNLFLSTWRNVFISE